MVAPLQMAAAISAVANDGKMMAPHIVRAIVDKGQQFNIEPVCDQCADQKRSRDTLTDMLAISLEQEASDALVEGYRVAKNRVQPRSRPHLDTHPARTNASFVGWGRWMTRSS